MSNDPEHLARQDSSGQLLEYRPGAADRVPVKSGQVVRGIAISVFLGMGAVFLGILASLGHRPGTSSAIPLIAAICGALLGLNVWAYAAHRSPRFRGLGLGLWIGIGVTVLIEGACFGLGRL